MRAHRSACRREEMGILQAQLLTYQREDGTVQHLVFQMQGNRRFLAQAEIFDVMLMTYAQRMLKEFTLHGAGMLYLVHDAHVDLLPEAGHCRHTGGMCLAH